MNYYFERNTNKFYILNIELFNYGIQQIHSGFVHYVQIDFEYKINTDRFMLMLQDISRNNLEVNFIRKEHKWR